jgi:hypothetical protein
VPEEIERIINTVRCETKNCPDLGYCLPLVLPQTVEKYLKEKPWDQAMIPNYIDSICDMTMKELNALNKPFKYIGLLRKHLFCAGRSLTSPCCSDLSNNAEERRWDSLSKCMF